MGIRTKLLTTAIVCWVLPLVITFVITFNAARDSIRERVGQNIIADATGYLESLQQHLSDAKRQFDMLSSLSSMQEVLSGDHAGKLQTDIDKFSSRAQLFAEVLAADHVGVVVASNALEHIGTSTRGTWEHEAPMLGVKLDTRVVKSHRADKMVLSLGSPLRHQRDKNLIIGTLIGSIDWEQMQNKLRAHTVFGKPQGLQRRIILESPEYDTILYSTNDMDVDRNLLKQSSDAAVIKHVVVDGHEFEMVTIHSNAYDGYRDPNWRLHVLLDRDIAYETVNNVKRYFILAGCIMLALSLLASYVVSRKIVSPVLSLAKGAEKLAEGDYSYTLEYKGSDEIAELTNSFNVMRIAIKQNEKELRKKSEIAEQASKLKSEFLANMSHEVRTPINGVMGMTELLMNTSLDETQTRYAKTISRSSQSLLSVINDILDFSKIEAGKLELTASAFDLRDLVEDVTEMVSEMAHRKGIEISQNLHPGSHTVFHGDCGRLRQILTNLLSNAVKFTKSGEVKLIVSVPDYDQSNKPMAIDFKVIDTGIGISEKNQKKIFDSFVQADGSTTRRFGGTGLGLAISSKLVSIMGGELKVSSELDVGSTFSFAVKLKPMPSELKHAWSSNNALAGKRILIVDDNETNREILDTHTRFWGAQTTLATSGGEALELIRQAMNTNEEFDICITDMHMPQFNGIQLIDKLNQQEIAGDTRFILLSSVSDTVDLDTSVSLGIRSFANKPVKQSELYKCLISALQDMPDSNLSKKSIAKKIVANKLSGNVLLAEDNPVNQDMVVEMLKIIGVSVKVVNNGQEALDALDKEAFDLVLMDCQMPVLDGLAATRKIRESESGGASRLPIIALTANAMQGDRETCINAGMDQYLSKPVTSTELNDVLRNWLPNPREKEIVALTRNESESHENLKNGNLVGSNESHNESAANPNELDMNENLFDEVWSMSQQAGSGFYEQLVSTYETDSIEHLNKIAEAIEREDSTTVASSAHRLKSGTASWGAVSLADLFFSLECCGKDGDISDAHVILDQARAQHVMLLSYLRAKMPKAA